MRRVQVALGVAAATLVSAACVLAGIQPASAEGSSAESIERRLAQQRQRLEALYNEAASAATQFDSAQNQLASAQQAVERERKAMQDANQRRAAQSRAVAILTVQQLQAGSELHRLAAMLDSTGPPDLLARISAYDSAAEAMTARVDELAGRVMTHRATQRRLESALDDQRAAVERMRSDRATINAAIARSKAATRNAEAEQRELLRQLAATGVDAARGTAPGPSPSSTSPPDARDTVTTAPSSGPPPTPPATPPASADDDAVWDRIAKCESGGRWNINTGNGYYGGLQFSARTWRGIGGPGLPHEHSREVQIHYAKLLQARYGWGQWSCAWARHGS